MTSSSMWLAGKRSTAAVFALVVLAATSAFANPTRIDLVNSDTDSTAFTLVQGMQNGSIFVGRVEPRDALPEPPNGLVQTLTAFAVGGNVVAYVVSANAAQRAGWVSQLVEFDKVNRLPDRSQAALVQRDYAGTLMTFASGGVVQTYFNGAPTAGCQGKIRYQVYSEFDQAVGGTLPGAWTQVQGTLVCEQFSLDNGIIDPAIRTRIQQLIGTKSDGTGLRAEFTAPTFNLQ